MNCKKSLCAFKDQLFILFKLIDVIRLGINPKFITE